MKRVPRETWVKQAQRVLREMEVILALPVPRATRERPDLKALQALPAPRATLDLMV